MAYADITQPEKFRAFLQRHNADILHEGYSITVDWPNPDMEIIRMLDESESFNVQCEKGSIWSIELTNH